MLLSHSLRIFLPLLPKPFLTLVIFDLLLVGLLYGVPLEAHPELIYGLSTALHYMKAVACHSGVRKTKAGDCTHAVGQIHRDALDLLSVSQRYLAEDLCYILGLSSFYYGYYRTSPSMRILIMNYGIYIVVHTCLVNALTWTYVCHVQYIIFRMLLLIP